MLTSPTTHAFVPSTLYGVSSEAEKNPPFDFNTLIKKKTLVLGGFSLGIVLSLILFTVAFYEDPVTKNLISEKGLTLDAGHQFLSYFFIILTGLTMMSFITSFFYYFFFNNLEDKFRKIFKIIMYTSIPLFIIFFIWL